jgi:hypothetical protein
MDREHPGLPITLVRLVNTLAALAAAGFFVLWYAEVVGEEWKPTAFVASVCLLALNVVRLLYLRAPRPVPAHVVSLGRAGEVRVAREALEAGLRAAGEKLPEVARLRVSVLPEGSRRILVRAWYVATDNVRIMDVSEALRARLRERFLEMITMAPDGRLEFELEFEGFSGRAPRKPEDGKVAGKRQAEAAPFTGPQYPIDDADEV